MKVSFKKSSESPSTTNQTAKRQFPILRWIGVLLVITGPFLYFAGSQVYKKVVVSAPGYVTLKKTTIRAPMAGKLEEVYVSISEKVKSGKPLVRLSNVELLHQEQALRGRLTQLAQHFKGKQSESQPHFEEIAAVAGNLVTISKEHLARITALQKKGASTSGEVSQAKSLLLQAQFNLNESRRDVALAEERFKREFRKDYLDTKAALEAELSLAKKKLLLFTLRAPFDGTVSQRYAEPGEFLTQGQALMTVISSKSPTITVYLPPSEAKLARLNQPVTILFSAGESIPGHISRPAEATKQLPSDQAGPVGKREIHLLVTVTPNQQIPESLDIDGMPVSVKFD